MSNFDPIDRYADQTANMPPIMQRRESGLTTLGIGIAAVVAMGIGSYMFKDNDNGRIAMKSSSLTMVQSTATEAKTDNN